MRAMLLFTFAIVVLSTTLAQMMNFGRQSTPVQQNFGMGRNFPQNDQNVGVNGISTSSNGRLSFPQCLQTDLARNLFSPASLQELFTKKLREEESKLQAERDRNDLSNNDDLMDFQAQQLRREGLDGTTLARTGIKLSAELLSLLACDINATNSPDVNAFLKKVRLPDRLCAYQRNPNCQGLTKYRTITGVCNNLQKPYQGSSQTAFARLLPAAYSDGLREPRWKSVRGDPLPPCRQISLAMGSKPISDQIFNNFWVIYGQFIVHDSTLAIPVTDAGRTPITSCGCHSKPDFDMCTVIDIQPDDPFMSGQHCMAFPATAEAFPDQTCTLSVKEQMNGNTHYIDLSTIYGSTRKTSQDLRAGVNGLMKSTQKPWAKLELPIGQREGRSCSDSTETNKCFAGGDSRLMENTIVAGIQAQWLRIHNWLARGLNNRHPDWTDNILFEESRKILTALQQHYAYTQWLPILIGEDLNRNAFRDDGFFSIYDPNLPGVVFNEASTAALRLHTFVRDLSSRCTPDGKLIDQLWLHEISGKCKFAYDMANNGVDSLLCGAMFDFGFAFDTNYAQEIHHHLFESTTKSGEKRGNDLISINICRGREHGLADYNTYRDFCGLPHANRFEDFGDTMSRESIDKLRSIYQNVNDVDLFVGINHENHLPGAIVGPVSACIIAKQFQNLKYGDRLFYSHEGQFTTDQLNAIRNFSHRCFVCRATDIRQVAQNPFRPPNDMTNPLQPCDQCLDLDLSAWDTSPSLN